MIKEIFIFLLLLIVVVLVLGILLYDHIPNNRHLPIAITAEPLPSDITETMHSSDGVEPPRVTFTTREDLRPVEAAINRGNINPFADLAAPAPIEVVGGNSSNTGGGNTSGQGNTGAQEGSTGGNTGGSSTSNSNNNNSNSNSNVGNFFEEPK